MIHHSVTIRWFSLGMKFLPAIVLIFLAACTKPLPEAPPPAPPTTELLPIGAPEPVPDDPDDPSVWFHPSDPSLNLIVGTNKVEKPNGALMVFDMNGKILQKITDLGRPNNVDVEQNVRLGDRTYDLAVTTEREAGALRIYAIDAASRRLSEIANLRVFETETGDFAAPMGIALFKRADGAVFAIVGRKSGPTEGYLWEYRIEAGPSLRLVRKFGKFSGTGEIEAIVVDDALGFVYYADESTGIRKYHADPDHRDAAQELALFGSTGYKGDREGLAIYATGPETGYLVSTDQIPGGSRYFLYSREGDQSQPIGVLQGSADATDGIEVAPGILIAMNSRPKTFLIFAWPQRYASPPEKASLLR